MFDLLLLFRVLSVLIVPIEVLWRGQVVGGAESVSNAGTVEVGVTSDLQPEVRKYHSTSHPPSEHSLPWSDPAVGRRVFQEKTPASELVWSQTLPWETRL